MKKILLEKLNKNSKKNLEAMKVLIRLTILFRIGYDSTKLEENSTCKIYKSEE